jgi:transcription initiation factor TFIIF subunit beta
LSNPDPHQTNITPQANQARKHAAKENRAARVDKHVLIDKLLELFRQHRIWGLRDLKSKVNQPEAYLRDTLGEIAFMWKMGDFNGKWELKPEFKMRDAALMNPTGVEVAPKEVDTDAEMGSGLGSEDEGGSDVFEDVG